MRNRYLIEGGTKQTRNNPVSGDEETIEIVTHSAVREFDSDEEAKLYAIDVRQQCKFDFAITWRFVGEDK